MEQREKRNAHGKTWDEYGKEIGHAMKNYLLIKITKSQIRTAKSMWRQNHTVSDIVSYILLSANPIK